MFLDDDFIFDKVDSSRISQMISWMKADNKIMCFRAIETNISERNKNNIEYEGFNLDSKKTFICSLNIMMCRKKQLLRQLKPSETPWDYEEFAQKRCKKWKGNYYSCKNGNQFIKYNPNMFTGYGVWKGEWLPNNVELFKKYNIDIDFSQRGIYTLTDVKKIRENDIAQYNNNKKGLSGLHNFVINFLYRIKKDILNFIWRFR